MEPEIDLHQPHAFHKQILQFREAFENFQRNSVDPGEQEVDFGDVFVDLIYHFRVVIFLD